MGLNWRDLIDQAPLILAGIAALMAGKTVLTFIAALASGWSRPGAAQLAFLTAQGSEFGLVLLALPATAAGLGLEVAGGLVAASAASLALTPAWTGLGMRLARKLAAQRARPCTPAAPQGERPILVFAMTAAGRMAMDGLKRFNIPAVAIDSDPRRFMAALADGYEVSFGDPSDLRLMNAVGAVNARALALAKSRYEISREVTPFVNETYPELQRFVVVDSEAEAERHRALGMHPVINRSSPEGADFAAALLHFAGVDQEAISQWMAELAQTHDLQPSAGARAA
jgi:CPA2 family monovalent cation:H+ antiporter-2